MLLSCLKTSSAPGLSSKCRIHSSHALGKTMLPSPCSLFCRSFVHRDLYSTHPKSTLGSLRSCVTYIHICLLQLSGEKSLPPPYTQFCWELPSMCSPFAYLSCSTLSLLTQPFFHRSVNSLNESPACSHLYFQCLNIPYHIVVATCSRNKLTQKDDADSGVQFITPAGPRQGLLLAKDPNQFL